MEIIPPKNQGASRQAYQRPVPPPPSGQQPPPQIPPLTYQPPKEPGSGHSFRGVISTIGLFVSAFLIAILLNTFVIQSYQVDGQSMEPTLQNDDRLIVNKIPRTVARIDGHQFVPHRGDIIIFNQDGLPGFIGQKQLIKRVIGLPGEHVVVADGKITIYNSAHPEGFNPDISGDYTITAPTTVGNVDQTLQKDELFVCGDNRGNSEDSRYFGPIKTNQVVAKLVLRILPLNKAQGF
jgi:signal peptidase I